MNAVSAGMVGRDEELGLLHVLLDAVDELPAAVLLEGEAGVGKTTLWAAGVAAAGERGYRVLSCTPTSSETQLSFAALGDMLEGVLEHALPVLPVPQRRALEVALLLEEADGPPPDQRAIGLSFLGILRVLSGTGPVLVAVDDLQWIDRPSALALEFAARRTLDEPVAFLFALRSGSSRPDLLLDRELSERLRKLAVGPLSLGALHHLLRSRVDTPISRPTLRRIHDVSGGNPFYALELARMIDQGGERRVGVVELELPSSLHELVEARLAVLPASAQAALLAAAALSRPTLAELEEALGRSPERDLAPAIEASIVELDEGRVHFSHPLLASAVRARADPSRLQRLHRLLSTLVDDPEERARHLALATGEPDAGTAAALEEAAERSRARGAPTVAAELAEQAARLTPGEEAEQARTRHILAAQFYFDAGDSEAATRVLEEALAHAPFGLPRARLLVRLARVRYESVAGDEGIALYREALGEAAGDVRLEAQIHQELARVLLLWVDLDAAERHAREALTLAETLGDPDALALSLATMAAVEFRRGRGLQRELHERGIALEDAGQRLRIDDRPSTLWGGQLLTVGDIDAARSLFEALRDEAVADDDLSLQIVLYCLAVLEISAGNWARAERYAEDSYDLAVQGGRETEAASNLWALAYVHALQGHVEVARAQVSEVLAMSERTSQVGFTIHGHALLGLLALSVDDWAEADRHLAFAADRLLATGVREPGMLALLLDAIEAKIALGQLDEAQALLDPLERDALSLDRSWIVAGAERCRALLLAARGDLEPALECLERALAEHDRTPMPFERGRTLLVRGSIRRRAKQKRAARESLEQALVLFEELGARLWVEKTRAELARVGGRRASGKLTPTERRVAELAAEGLANKEIASRLFVTVKTVEANLSRIYAKLGVRSRTALARRLAGKDRASKL